MKEKNQFIPGMTIPGQSDTLPPIKITRVNQSYSGGTWISGLVGSFRFQALVFSDHAIDPEWELARSRISKLCLRRRVDDEIVYAWERGLVVSTTDPVAEDALTMICDTVASAVFGKPH